MGLYVLAGIVSAIVDLRLIQLIGNESLTEDEANGIDNASTMVGYAMLALFVVAAVAYLIWLFRARSNAERSAPVHHRHPKVWLVLGWGFPIIAFWFPKQFMDDIWNASNTTAFTMRRRPGLIWAWWLAWLADRIYAQIVSRMLRDAEVTGDLDSIVTVLWADVASVAVELVAAVLAAAVVLRITAFQEERRLAPAVPVWNPA
ncbi:MAG: DUF4328 domain-containing protein [Nonomuraea sp.]|nr:DUF4328 domain-containing protein [Nonomuraea sp.]